MTDTSACYVYGIVPTGAAIPAGLVGLDGELVEFVERDGVAAIVSRAVVDRPLGRRADLLAHSLVLDTLAVEGPVIPVRFGSVLPGRDDVVGEMLGPNVEHFGQVLTDLRGKTQFNLRASYDEETILAEVVAESPDVAELRSQTRKQPEEATHAARIQLGELVARALEAKRDIDGRLIMETVLPHTIAYDVDEGGEPDHLLDAAFLVENDRREEFEAAAEDAAATLGDRGRLKLIGPSAPYNFVPME